MISYEVDGHVARLTIRRAEKHNALTAELVEQLLDHLERASADDDVKVSVLSAEGPTFCAGFDISAREAFDGPPDATRRSRVQAVAEKAEWMRRILTTRKPLVVAVQGPCIGIGMYLVLVADFAIATDGATFGLPLRPAIDDVLITLPDCCAVITGKTCCNPRNAPRTLTAITASKSASL